MNKQPDWGDEGRTQRDGFDWPLLIIWGVVIGLLLGNLWPF